MWRKASALRRSDRTDEVGQARERNRAFQQRIVLVHVQVHEIECGHIFPKLE